MGKGLFLASRFAADKLCWCMCAAAAAAAADAEDRCFGKGFFKDFGVIDRL